MDSLGLWKASSDAEEEIGAIPRELGQVACNYRNPKKRYEKLGSAGITGSLYQIGLLTVVLLNAIRKVKNWRLSTEDKAAAQLDDLIFEHLPSESAILLQAKHKEDEEKIVTYKDLMSVNKNSEFSLPKYFFSYQEVKNRFRVQMVGICTNLKLDKQTKGILKEENVNPDSVLHFEGADNICYGFSGCSLPELKQNIETYHAKYLQKKEVPISDEDINDFLKHLTFYPNCLGDKNVDRIIKQTISRVKFSENLNREMIQIYIKKKMTDWFTEKKGRYLTETEAKAFFCDMRSNKYCKELKRYDISFKNDNLPLILQIQERNEKNGENSRQQNETVEPAKHPKRVSHIIYDKEYMLNVVKIYQALPPHHREKTLFVNPDETVKVRKEMVDAFEVPHYTILVMACPNTIEETIAGEMCDRLKQILGTHKHKHLILIAGEGNYLATQLKDANIDYEAITDSVTFTDLEEAAQGAFKRKKLINFQGRTMSLEELFPLSTEDLNKIVNSEMLVKLARGRKSEVGGELPHLDNYYLSRSFNLNDQNISEEDLWRSTEISGDRVILISDSAGMGKSSVLTSLGVSIKRDNPHLWVVRFDLGNYTHVMRATLEENRKSVGLIEMLNSLERSRLKSEFDKRLFATPKRVVLMLDGVDEVSPSFTELVMNLIRDSLALGNLAKIFVTTRPHMSEDFEKISQLQSLTFEQSSKNYQERIPRLKFFTLEPFSELDQKAFLIKYWTGTLDLQGDVEKSRCKIFAETLIKNLSVWLNEIDRNDFAGIPLQTRMLAEIFQEENGEEHDWEGCKEFSSSNNEEPKLPTRIDITQLYKLFIDKKTDIYIKKSSPGRHSAADEALKFQLKECQKFHRALALKIIFETDKVLKLFTSYTNVEWPIPTTFANNFLFRVGIVQSREGNIEFLHRTFAEYFALDCLLIELDRKPVNEEFQQFFMVCIVMSDKFYVIRAFLDSRMQNVWHLMENNFCTYFRRNRISSWRLSDYFDAFASLGCARIFKCFIECVDKEQREILRQTVNELNLMYKPLGLALRFEQFDSLKLLLELNETFNTGKDEYKQFLVFVVLRALDHNLETFKFLPRQADKSENILGRPSLHEAALTGRLEVIKFLIKEAEVDINVQYENGETILHRAVFWDEIEIVKYLVRQPGADINIQNNDGEAPLHMATYWGGLEMVKHLVEAAGVDINIRNSKGETALHKATLKGRLEALKYLVEAGADINVKNNDGKAPLHTAAYWHELEVVRCLVEGAGVDINIKNSKGETALHTATGNGELETLKYLVEAGADINVKNNEGEASLHIAAYCGRLEVIRFMVEGAGADINIKNSEGETALHTATRNGKLETLKYLVHAGADINVKDNNGEAPLHTAAYCGRLEVINFIVEGAKVDINIKNSKGETALHTATRNGKLETIKYLVEAGANINVKNNDGKAPLHIAAYCGRLEVISFIVEGAGADINIKNRRGETALHIITLTGKLETLKYLVDAGADINVKDNDGEEPLLLAAYWGRLEVVRFLVEGAGVDINIKNRRGETALHIVTLTGKLETLKYLVDAGADINVKDNDGEAPLLTAAYWGRLEVVRFLLEGAGADINIKNSKGETALHRASRKGKLETLKYLVDAGADINIKDNRGRTALRVAANQGRWEVVEFLSNSNRWVMFKLRTIQFFRGNFP